MARSGRLLGLSVLALASCQVLSGLDQFELAGAGGAAGGPATGGGGASSSTGGGASSTGGGGVGGSGGSTFPGVVAPCKSAPIIDGPLDASWTGPEYSAALLVMGTMPNVGAAVFQARWDPAYLYVGAAVDDAALYNDSVDEHFDDSVEVYLDMNNDKTFVYGSDDFQYIAGWNDAAVFEINGRTTGVFHGSASVLGGYELEIAIPWTTLGVTPAADMVIGFDFGTNFDQNGGIRDAQLMWHGTANNYMDTSAFGELLLLACP